MAEAEVTTRTPEHISHAVYASIEVTGLAHTLRRLNKENM